MLNVNSISNKALHALGIFSSSFLRIFLMLITAFSLCKATFLEKHFNF